MKEVGAIDLEKRKPKEIWPLFLRPPKTCHGTKQRDTIVMAPEGKVKDYGWNLPGDKEFSYANKITFGQGIAV